MSSNTVANPALTAMPTTGNSLSEPKHVLLPDYSNYVVWKRSIEQLALKTARPSQWAATQPADTDEAYMLILQSLSPKCLALATKVAESATASAAWTVIVRAVEGSTSDAAKQLALRLRVQRERKHRLSLSSRRFAQQCHLTY